ncbi:protein ROOT INITIATION DEFECTIVE 3-like [Cornus florida]|uniref:protein ROOT INITIATION DEFECTIVE 3-like n=1 Tax=Cornus florida TaxID=4283 RepID=UPI002896A00D|nr:protein ROOT INITIATION DEFECTIVE 3-like [Cornus florida]
MSFISHLKMASTMKEIILTSSTDGPIVACDASSGATLARFMGSRSPRKGLALAGKKLIAASHVCSDTGSGSVHLYNWWSSTSFHNLPVPEPVAPLAATLDGLYLFAGGLSGHIHALSLPSGDFVHSVAAHSKAVSCLEINHDGSLLFSGSDDGTIAVLPIYKLLDDSPNKNSTNIILQRFVGHGSSVTTIVTGIGGSNCTILSCSLDCTCKFWSLMHGTELRTVAFPSTIWSAVIDPTESEFYIGGSDGLVYSAALKVAGRNLVKQGREMVSWAQRHDRAIVGMAMMNRGRNLVTASEDGSVWIWEVERRQVIKVVLDQEKGSISELLVAKGFGDGGESGVRMGGGNAESSGWSLGLSGGELSRPIREVMDMEQTLSVLAQDRSRAIDTLGSAIETYEKLLELILKEAKRGTNSNNSDEE